MAWTIILVLVVLATYWFVRMAKNKDVAGCYCAECKSRKECHCKYKGTVGWGGEPVCIFDSKYKCWMGRHNVKKKKRRDRLEVCKRIWFEFWGEN